MIGKILSSRYKITQTLGSGGFGQTFLAEDTQIPGNPVCVVKQLKPLSNSPDQLAKAKELFKQEAEKLVQLGRHDQIPELLASFQDGDDLFLIQQYIEGQTLDTELQPGQIWPEQKVIQFLLDLLPVLDFIHKAGTIHRDIKPPNIIRRNRDNKPVLIDFGAVKEVQAQVGSTIQPTVATGTVIGTRGYMSSEQGQGKPRPSSDLYALGIICLQALTGKMPNQLDDDVDSGELVWKHLVQASPGLKQVLEKMTRYHFRERYQSAAEALQSVQSLTSANYPPTIDATKWVNPDPIPTPNPIPQPPQPPQPEPIPPNPVPPSPTPQPNPPSPKPPKNYRGYWILASVIAGLFAGLLRFAFSYSPYPDPKQILDTDVNCLIMQGRGRNFVRLREEPKKDSTEVIKGGLSNGTKAKKIGENSGFYQIQSGSNIGWVFIEQTSKCNTSNDTQNTSTQSLQTGGAVSESPTISSSPIQSVSPSSQTSESTYVVIKNSQDTNLRSDAGTDSNVIGLAKSGDKARVIEQKNDKGSYGWSYVRILGSSDSEGWIADQFLEPSTAP
jgi:serine/threonine protein kinase, bacterial